MTDVLFSVWFPTSLRNSAHLEPPKIRSPTILDVHKFSENSWQRPARTAAKLRFMRRGFGLGTEQNLVPIHALLGLPIRCRWQPDVRGGDSLTYGANTSR